MQPPQKSKKKLLILVTVVIILVAIGIGIFLMLRSRKAGDTAGPKVPAKPVTVGVLPNAITYAGHKVYDACNLIPLSVFQNSVENYKSTTVFNSGTLLNDPVMIERGYIDRDIPVPLGRDATAREPGTLVSETGIDTSVRANSFMSIGDTYCMWGQGETLGTTFAKVYIVQPPKPIHEKLNGYLNELKQNGGYIGEELGVQIYVEKVKEGDNKVIGIFRKGDTIVFMASHISSVLEAATPELVKALSKEPTGPMTVTYPLPYENITNPCELFTAADFERLLGKPASSVTQDTIGLTERARGTAQRECSRYEVERLREGEVTTSDVILMESRSVEQAKLQLADLKAKFDATVTSLPNLGDEAYLLSSNFEKSIVFRIGDRNVKVITQGEAKDTNIDTFKQRTLPVAQVVLSNLKK